MARIDTINCVLILLATAIARLVPLELLLFSYAVLGPAHYLTQISWMREKKYFCKEPSYFLPMLCVLTLLAILIPPLATEAMLATLLLCFLSLLSLSNAQRWAVFAVGFFLAVVLVGWTGPLVLITIVLPTVIHVYVFTGVFMVVGAMRSKRWDALLAFVLLLLAGISFFIFPETRSQTLTPYLENNRTFFGGIIDYLQRLTDGDGSAKNLAAITGFLGFAYTYHYLNCFSKVEVIGWHKQPRRRWLPLVLLYLMALATYAIDYTLGFGVLLFLSYLHVTLEFPLNMRSFALVGQGCTA